MPKSAFHFLNHLKKLYLRFNKLTKNTGTSPKNLMKSNHLSSLTSLTHLTI